MTTATINITENSKTVTIFKNGVRVSTTPLNMVDLSICSVIHVRKSIIGRDTKWHTVRGGKNGHICPMLG